MTQMDAMQPRRLACYLLEEATKIAIEAIPFKEFNLTLELYEGGIAYAIEHLKKERSPDIILVDISKSTMPLSDLAALAEACEPRVEVIVLGEKNDVGLFRSLLQAGVRDYLVKPLMESILIKSIQEIVQHEAVSSNPSLGSLKAGKIIAVMGSRGGIGVSSIVSNLGVALSETHEKRTCIIDMDMHTGTLPQYLDIESSEGFSQLFESPDRIDKVLLDRYMTFYNDRLGILCSELSLLEKPQIKLESIDSLFNFIAPQFHYTLIDLPRHFSQAITSHVLTHVSQLIVLCDYSITSLKDTCRLLQMTKAFPNLTQGTIILANQIDLHKKGNIDRETYEATIQRPINLEIKFDPFHPLQGVLDGDPVVINNRGELAYGVQSLCQLIMGIPLSQKSEKRWWNRLFNNRRL
ncbi:MAG: P-loop NTPase [Candidatus Paracaedibacteraceae bacterium]|nr:P-loop NTPase [Candidatus Paracaedibacteraceae bacterium]